MTQCPAEYVGTDIWNMIDLARFADGNVLPVAGGVLDQTQSFLEFLTVWRVAQAEAKQEAMNRG